MLSSIPSHSRLQRRQVRVVLDQCSLEASMVRYKYKELRHYEIQ